MSPTLVNEAVQIALAAETRVEDGQCRGEWDSIGIETLAGGAFELGPAASQGTGIE